MTKPKLFNQTLASDDSVISAKSVLKKKFIKGKENDPDFHSDPSEDGEYEWLELFFINKLWLEFFCFFKTTS